jgi:hypothetical protein
MSELIYQKGVCAKQYFFHYIIVTYIKELSLSNQPASIVLLLSRVARNATTDSYQLHQI